MKNEEIENSKEELICDLKKTTFVLLSDTHGRHENIHVMRPEDSLENLETLYHITGDVFLPKSVDAIIHAGDISMSGTEYEIDNFLKWYSGLPYKYKILIAGNHDKLFERNKLLAKELLMKYQNIIYLESSEIEINGIRIYGEPRQPTFGYGWAFNVERGESIAKYWNEIPNGIDILVTHGPPKGILDMTLIGEQVGCEDLLHKISEIKPLCVVYGHIHENYGYELIGDIHYFNASVLNLRYQLQNLPRIIEIDENKKLTIIQ